MDEKRFGGYLTHKLKKEVWERDDYTCAYCGLRMHTHYMLWRFGLLKRKDAKLTIDHIIPRQSPHTFKINHLDNLTTACYDCNQKKGGRDNIK